MKKGPIAQIIRIMNILQRLHCHGHSSSCFYLTIHLKADLAKFFLEMSLARKDLLVFREYETNVAVF